MPHDTSSPATGSDAARAQGSGLRPAALAFLALLATSVLVFLVTAWLAGTPPGAWLDPETWSRRLTDDAAREAVGNAAELVAGVLAIAVTVVAIVLELAANRYTHRITPLFVREPVNALVMGFFVVTTVECVWAASLLGGPSAGRGARVGLLLTVVMVSVSLLLLLPYFAYVFRFLSPLQMVERLRSQALRTVRDAARAGGGDDRRQATIEAIEDLEDVAHSAMLHHDRGIAMSAVDALAELLEDVEPLRPRLPDAWFAMEGALRRDPDFVALAPSASEEMERDRFWLEAKVLRQYLAIFMEGVGDARDVCNLVALETRRMAERLARAGDAERLGLCVRFLNSYLRMSLNKRDLRTAYYVLHQVRVLGEVLIDLDHDEEVCALANHLRYYGLLGAATGQAFMLETVAYDLALLLEHAAEARPTLVDPLLEVLLRVDRESEDASQESSLRGVRRAQAQLATFFLERGDAERARRIAADMAGERPERLAAVRDELLGETRDQYWEYTDRGVNFAYLPPARRSRVPEFFALIEAAS